MAKSAGRRGRPYERARKQALTASQTCWICGHEGARTADHVIPRSICLLNGWKHLLDSASNLRPAHGAGNRCPVCGQCCNEKRGNGIRRAATPKRTGRRQLSRVW